MFQRLTKPHLLNLIAIALFLVLPYYLFQGKLYVGGDDSRLLYSYPLEYLKNIVLFSWSNFSAVGSDSPQQILAPFLTVWSGVSFFIRSRAVLEYLAFSLPLIISFIYFQKFMRELVDKKGKYRYEILAGSLFFILSPILIINQLFIFLTTVWFLGLTFILIYYFLRYLENSEFSDVFKGMIWTTILSLSFFSIPWILGLLMPLFTGLFIIAVKFSKNQILNFVKKFILFFGFIILSQSFWMVSLVMSVVKVDINSPTGKVVNPAYISTFLTTINSTAIGNVFYPLLNLFHRQIAFSFGWKLADVFTSFYDKTIILNLIFIFVLILGLINYKKVFGRVEKSIFLLFTISSILLLFLFTVNIGPLKNLFIEFGKIPGFVMFRNFYDKFAPAYVICYSILITLCLIIIRKSQAFRGKYVTAFFVLVTLINFIPVKPTVDSALWTTQTIYKNISIPKEYLDTMNFIKENISPTNTILSYPFGTSIYTVIKESGTNNVYLGTSPVKVFSGVNDISGFYSFNFTREATDSYTDIISRDSSGFSKLLYQHNINYVLATNNIPEEVKKSWVYDPTMLKVQDNNFLESITKKRIYKSSGGNYEIYQTKSKNELISSENISFQKINQTKYKILFKNLKKRQVLNFYDSFNSGWKLFLKPYSDKFDCANIATLKSVNTTECKDSFKIFEGDELGYLWQKPIFDGNHTMVNRFSNQWIVDPKYIKNNYGNSYYKVNPDGSIDVEFVMYFLPQLYFYYGAIVSFLVIFASAAYLIFRKFKNENKK